MLAKNNKKLINSSDAFECIMCGECCKGYGGNFITNIDIQKICKFMDISYEKFILKYIKRSGNKFVLSQQENGYCIFWDKIYSCLIHPVKPYMCNQWPFIRSVLIDIKNWEIMASCCPGIKTDIDDKQLKAFISKKIKNETKIII